MSNREEIKKEMIECIENPKKGVQLLIETEYKEGSKIYTATSPEADENTIKQCFFNGLKTHFNVTCQVLEIHPAVLISELLKDVRETPEIIVLKSLEEEVIN